MANYKDSKTNIMARHWGLEFFRLLDYYVA